jgi:xylan 1,4-beta-xylosidase
VRKGAGVTVLLANHALPRQPIEAQRVWVTLADAPPPRAVTLERIDDEHANAPAAWRALGGPEYLSDGQVRQLEEASRLRPEAQPWKYEGGAAHLEVTLPPHAVAALTVDFAPTAAGP